MHDMAVYMWRFEGEGTAKALVAAEINNTLAHFCISDRIADEKVKLFQKNSK